MASSNGMSTVTILLKCKKMQSYGQVLISIFVFKIYALDLERWTELKYIHVIHADL